MLLKCWASVVDSVLALTQHYVSVSCSLCASQSSRAYQTRRLAYVYRYFHPCVKVSIVGSLRDPEVAASASDRQGSNFESCVWNTLSSQSPHYPQEVLLAQFSRYVHKGGLKPDFFYFYRYVLHTINLPVLQERSFSIIKFYIYV